MNSADIFALQLRIPSQLWLWRFRNLCCINSGRWWLLLERNESKLAKILSGRQELGSDHPLAEDSILVGPEFALLDLKLGARGQQGLVVQIVQPCCGVLHTGVLLAGLGDQVLGIARFLPGRAHAEGLVRTHDLVQSEI